MKNWFESLRNRSFEEKMVILTVTLVLLSLVGCSVSSIMEIIALRPPKRYVKQAQTSAVKPQEELKPPIHPLEMLPERVEGFNTNGRQKMPGAEGYIAEAIYQPDDKDIVTMTPLNTYVSVTYHHSEKEARESIATSVKEQYPVTQDTLGIDGLTALSGFDSSHGSFYIGWTTGQYSIELFTSFTVGIPPNKESLLVDYGKKVSTAVNSASTKALGSRTE